MTDETPTPASPAITKDPVNRDGRPGFIADLGFTLVVPWLVLWRFELPAGPGHSLWSGWWPVIVVLGLLAIAMAIGVAQRNPRGFLPYNVRWGLLAATLVLPAWIAISLADRDERPVTFRSAAVSVRPAVEDRLAAATTPAERERSRDALAAIESSERLAELAQTSEDQGKPLVQRPIPGISQDLEPAAKKTFEQSAALAEGIDRGDPLPPEVAAGGMDDAQVLAALLVVAAALLAPMLGLSFEITLTLLKTLVASGAITAGSIVQVTAAMSDALLPGGGYDEGKIRKNLEKYDHLGRSVDIIIDAAREQGADVDRSPLGQARHGKPRGNIDVGLDKRRADCRNAFKPGETPVRADVQRRCPDLNPDEIDKLLRELQPGGKR